jgi:hypothetical protein
MAPTTQDLEAKLLEILNQPEKTESVVDAIEKSADGQEAELTDEQRATLGALLEAGLPTPEEIVRDAKIAEANARIEQARKVDLARRKERRAKRGKHRRR